MNKTSQNGKGSSRRKEDYKKVSNNWDLIDWRKKGTYCFDCGKTFKTDEKRLYYDDENAHCNECNFN